MTHNMRRYMHNRISGIAVLILVAIQPAVVWSNEAVQAEVKQPEGVIAGKVEKVALAEQLERPVLEVKIKHNTIRVEKHDAEPGSAVVNEKTITTDDELAAVRPVTDIQGVLTNGVGKAAVEPGSELAGENNINSRRRKVNVEGVAMLRRMLWMTLFYSGSK